MFFSYQETACPLVQNHLRKSSGSSNPASPGTPPPRAQSSPARTKAKNDVKADAKTEIDGGDENLEEVYKYVYNKLFLSRWVHVKFADTLVILGHLDFQVLPADVCDARLPRSRIMASNVWREQLPAKIVELATWPM